MRYAKLIGTKGDLSVEAADVMELNVSRWNEKTLEETAARLVSEYHVSVIDINFGCPAKRIAGSSASARR